MPCEKNEQRSEFRSGAFCCFRMAKKSTSKKLTSQCRPEEDPGVSSCLPGTRVAQVQGRANAKRLKQKRAYHG